MIEKELLEKIFPEKPMELDWNIYLLYLGARAFLLYRLNYDANITALEHNLFLQTLHNLEQNYKDSVFAYTEQNIIKIIDKINDIIVKLAIVKIVTTITMPSTETNIFNGEENEQL